MPYIEGIADKPEPDHYPVREKITVEEGILTCSNHKDCSHNREKRLVPREVLIVEREYSSENQRKPDDREDVPAEPDAV